MGMVANPKPNKGVFDLGGKRKMIHSNSYRPSVFGNLFKLKGRVKRVSAPNPVLFAGQSADLGCERSIGVPEGFVRAADHGSRWVFPARKSDFAWSIMLRNRPPGCASSAIWLSHVRALYSASHSARRSTSAGVSCSISVWRSSTFLMHIGYPCYCIHSSAFPAEYVCLSGAGLRRPREFDDLDRT
jgi:hypothetical protein